ncbi:MAG: hypothetical protein KatS3mg104_2975 [Phycisphaerae bacterium]|nr:MAG: hypothetical protein KatS3mg104_2975 [Phycisphaerae bacterium]
MISYKDRTFCPFHEGCALGKHCDRALTDLVISEAIKWWGDVDAPISMFTEPPPCFETFQTLVETINGSDDDG